MACSELLTSGVTTTAATCVYCTIAVTAIDQSGTALLEPLHGERWARAVAQQSLQPGPVGGFDAHPGMDREAAAVGVGSHVFGITRLKVAECHVGTQDASAHVGLYLGDGLCVYLSRLQNQTLWQGLKHPVDYAHMEMHVRVQRPRHG